MARLYTSLKIMIAQPVLGRQADKGRQARGWVGKEVEKANMQVGREKEAR